MRKGIPNFLEQPEFDREPEGMAALREKVYAYRLGRTALHRDDKVLAAWNGLALAALARAGLILDEPRYLDASRRTAEFLEGKLTGSDGKLLARWRDGDAAHSGKLDDYAFYAYGLMEPYGATFDVSYLARAAELQLSWLTGRRRTIPPGTALPCWCFWRNCGRPPSWWSRRGKCRRNCGPFCGKGPARDWRCW